MGEPWERHWFERPWRKPICGLLPIAPSTYSERLAKRADPARLSGPARRYEALRPEIHRVFEANWRVYGARKVWRQLCREGFDVARCTVARLMKGMVRAFAIGLEPMAPEWLSPGQTAQDDDPGPEGLVPAGQGEPPVPRFGTNMLWVSDFTCVALWKGFVYGAPRHGLSDQWRSHGSIIDAAARKIVGWRVSTPAHAGPRHGLSDQWRNHGSILDALEQAVHDRRPGKGMGLVHHSDRGSQYLSVRDSERLAEAGIEPSVATAMTRPWPRQSPITRPHWGHSPLPMFTAEVIHRRGTWRSFEAAEYATLEWVDWFNNRRLLEPIGNIPPAKAEANVNTALETAVLAAQQEALVA